MEIKKNQADLILEQREKKGLIISNSIRIIFLISFILVNSFTYHSQEELKRALIISCFFVCLLSLFIYFIRKGKFFQTIGYASISVDAFFLIFLPYNWYLAVGFYESVPSTYLLKTSLPSIAFVFVCVSALAIRPFYPIIVAIIFNSIWGFFFYVVFQDPRTEFTESFLDNFFTAKIIPTYYITLSLSITSVALIVAFITHSYRRSIKEAVGFEIQNSQMSRYFSPGILKEIKDDESIFQAKTTPVVVMFVDIRGFTTLSESMNAEQVVQFLREYHSMMVEIIYSEEGTIDKFLGDGIMVSFGTPTPGTKDATHAINCAIKMRIALDEWNQARISKGYSPVNQGIGIHFGSVVSGNIGSEDRLEYTVIGDTVNVASRIEGLCKEYKVDLLVSKQLVEKYREENPNPSSTRFESMGDATIRGKKEKIELYRII
jgi:adenylate cyclase